MAKLLLRLLLCLAVIVMSAGSLLAQLPDAYDVRLTNELRAVDPAAAAIWTQANAAREANKSEEAIRLYAQVLARVPSFNHALRRMAYQENVLGRRAQAIEHMRDALAQQRSAENLGALARILTEVPDGTASEAESNEAKALVDEAVKTYPKEKFAYEARARWRCSGRIGECSTSRSIA